VGTTCDVGYTEWLDGFCFVNCNSLFIENGTTCIKKTYYRDSVYPTSVGVGSGLESATDSDQNGTWLFIITIILLVIICIIIGVGLWKFAKKSNYY